MKEILIEDEICEYRLAGERRVVVLNAVEANRVVVLSEKGKKDRSCLVWICFHERNDHGSNALPRIEKRGIEYETSGLSAWMRLRRKGKMFFKKS